MRGMREAQAHLEKAPNPKAVWKWDDYLADANRIPTFRLVSVEKKALPAYTRWRASGNDPVGT